MFSIPVGTGLYVPVHILALLNEVPVDPFRNGGNVLLEICLGFGALFADWLGKITVNNVEGIAARLHIKIFHAFICQGVTHLTEWFQLLRIHMTFAPYEIKIPNSRSIANPYRVS
ncbi:hypothetical protein Mapa_005381 [Marchantia paleacea]|nr:hypothetical protein Mapa_005381 [Marchantia paleacea]